MYNAILFISILHLQSQLLCYASYGTNKTSNMVSRRLNEQCSGLKTKGNMKDFTKYFEGMNRIYRDHVEGTCYPVHRECGWPTTPTVSTTEPKQLPTFVLSIGLEGAGHHLWTEVLEQPVHDCVWINGRHYDRDIGDGVPKTSVSRLSSAIQEQFRLRAQAGKPPCQMIFDAEDSFPTGAIRKRGRTFMRPDIVNLQLLDGVLFHAKYLVILRNITDTTLSALRRNFFTEIDLSLRSTEHTLTYIEAALRSVPCHKMFIAHYEHFMNNPQAFGEPLAAFLELDDRRKQALKERLAGRQGRRVRRKAHTLTQYRECEGLAEDVCYKKVLSVMEGFFQPRAFMWPTFAANGFNLFD